MWTHAYINLLLTFCQQRLNFGMDIHYSDIFDTKCHCDNYVFLSNGTTMQTKCKFFILDDR